MSANGLFYDYHRAPKLTKRLRFFMVRQRAFIARMSRRDGVVRGLTAYLDCVRLEFVAAFWITTSRFLNVVVAVLRATERQINAIGGVK